jgi:hypothetical protein
MDFKDPLGSLHYDPRDEKWSLACDGEFYLWEGDPLDREDAESFARQIIGRRQRTLVGVDGSEVETP